MDHIKKLKNKKIGIAGMGYLGRAMFSYISNWKEEYQITLTGINKKNLHIVETESFDYFINMAGNSGDFRKNILLTIESNINLLTYLLKHLKVREHFVALSSTRIYGFSAKNNILFDENNYDCANHLDLDYIYDGTKKLLESIVNNYAKEQPYKSSIVRLSNVYGKFDVLNDATLIKKIYRCRKENQKLITSQNRYSTKDYIYIDDALDGILRVLLLSEQSNIFNIAHGKSYSLADISDFINLDVEYEDEQENSYYSNISINRAKGLVGFNPKVDIKTGLFQ